MGKPVIVEAVRTPIGKRGGVLVDIKPMQLLAQTLRGVVTRANLDPRLVEQVFGGRVTQGGEQANHLTRYAWLYAGLPYQTRGTYAAAGDGTPRARSPAVLVAHLRPVRTSRACSRESFTMSP